MSDSPVAAHLRWRHCQHPAAEAEERSSAMPDEQKLTARLKRNGL